VAALEQFAEALLDTMPALVAPALTPAQREAYRDDVDKRRASIAAPRLVEKRGPPLYVVAPRVAGMAASVATTVTQLLAQAATDEGMAVFTRDDASAILQRDADLQDPGRDRRG